MDDALRTYIRELVKKELDEANVTGNIDGGEGPPKTPIAFRSGNNNGKNIKKTGHADGHKAPEVFDYKKADITNKYIKNLYEDMLSNRTLTEKLSTEMRNLQIFIDNDQQIYKQRFIPILKNLSKKKKSGKYDPHLAPKIFMYLVDDGAKRYTKEYGGTVRDMFPKHDRMELAKEYVKDFEEAFDNKEYDFMESVNEDMTENPQIADAASTDYGKLKHAK